MNAIAKDRATPIALANPELFRERCYLDGQWVEADTRKRIDVDNPAEGTRQLLDKHGISTERVFKLAEGRPNIRDLIKNGKIQLVVNTPTKKGPATDEGKIRALCVANRVPIFTTLTAASAVARAIGAIQKGAWDVRPLQSYHASRH